MPPISKSSPQIFNPSYNPMNALVVPQAYPWTPYSALNFNPYPNSFFYNHRSLPSLPSFGHQEAKVNPIITTTVKPNKKFREPTTKHPNSLAGRSPVKNDKLSKNTSEGLKSDSRLLSAVQKVNPKFKIQNIIPIPGTRFYQIASVENFPQAIFPKVQNTNLDSDSDIQVEATGRTSAGESVPNISFGSYFLPYSSNIRSEGKKIASLILQPSSKAVVGNGGTAISAPISRAVLKKGVPTNIFFNPESVAIAGAGGKAHAQADLIIDVMD